MATDNTRLADAMGFLRQFKLRVFLLSALLGIPCFWHRRIEAGDLASHVYNVWLAQLIEKGQAPGLYLASRWDNVLFDFTLLHLANSLGFSIAERIAVYACVLIFFWGVFAFVAVLTDRPPWFLTPCIAMLAYGYSFTMGFMNYYLSLGLACFGLALFWGARGREWIHGATRGQVFGRLGPWTVLFLQRGGSIGALRAAVLLSCGGSFLIWVFQRSRGSLCGETRHFEMEEIRTAVRIVSGGVLRDGAAA